MRRCCEVCESFRPSAELEARQRLVELCFEKRSVTLCVGHARIAANSSVRSFADLRALFGRGRRSFVPRRGPEHGLIGHDERRTPGRRASDARSPEKRV
jgi:hypothetical protein